MRKRIRVERPKKTPRWLMRFIGGSSVYTFYRPEVAAGLVEEEIALRQLRRFVRAPETEAVARMEVGDALTEPREWELFRLENV